MLRRAAAATVVCFFSVGCHSASVEATLHNGTGSAMRLIEVDYPSASFGTQVLAAGESYTYRFKVLGDGALKLTYTGVQGREIVVKGPELHEGAEGALSIDVAPDGSVRWTPPTKPTKPTRPTK